MPFSAAAVLSEMTYEDLQIAVSHPEEVHEASGLIFDEHDLLLRVRAALSLGVRIVIEPANCEAQSTLQILSALDCDRKFHYYGTD